MQNTMRNRCIVFRYLPLLLDFLKQERAEWDNAIRGREVGPGELPQFNTHELDGGIPSRDASGRPLVRDRTRSLVLLALFASDRPLSALYLLQ
jgi:hypothetical protein